ncbi:MAG: alcohol dehydrogenase catalytic domain-containing protein [Blastocatellia bacterium]|nr:alcohol dehydrogenase catalytic domain-containing protein [Blastocatellia bacterium]
MKAIRFDGDNVALAEIPVPVIAGESLVRVVAVGVCNTDLEIVRGYAGFRGTLGHEFVGVVESSPDPSWIGARVVGEINCGCGSCARCAAGDPRHCLDRTVLGILNRDGAMAEYVSLPERNLLRVPDCVSDDRAIFVEPLAAACEILHQVAIDDSTTVALIGDGKLGLLIGQVLATTGARLTAYGRHRSKLAVLETKGATVRLSSDGHEDVRGAFDVVVEASGSTSGFAMAQAIVRPRGTIVLKSTIHGDVPFDATSLIVNEVTLVGSRCGRFEWALEMLEHGVVDVESMISRRMRLDDGDAVLAAAAEPGVLKVLVEVGDERN